MKLSLEPTASYTFPASIHAIAHDEKILTIHPERANWLVLESSEYPIFQYLEQRHTIAEAMASFDEEPVIRVLTEIEAKGFCNPATREASPVSPHQPDQCVQLPLLPLLHVLR